MTIRRQNSLIPMKVVRHKLKQDNSDRKSMNLRIIYLIANVVTIACCHEFYDKMMCSEYFQRVLQISHSDDLKKINKFCRPYINIAGMFPYRTSAILLAKLSHRFQSDPIMQVVKVVKLDTVDHCVKIELMGADTAKNTKLVLTRHCGAYTDLYVPVEPFVLGVLDGLNGAVPKLRNHFQLTQSEWGVIVMDYVDSNDTVMHRIRKQMIPLEEARLFVSRLTKILLRMMDLGVMHLDLHYANVFFISSSYAVKVIDFDKVAIGVENDGSQLYAWHAANIFKKIQKPDFIKATPEFFFSSLSAYEQKIVKKQFHYVPTRHAVFQIGTLLYHMVVNNDTVDSLDMIAFFRGKDALPVADTTVPLVVFDFLNRTMAIDYNDRLPLGHVMMHLMFFVPSLESERVVGTWEHLASVLGIDRDQYRIYKSRWQSMTSVMEERTRALSRLVRFHRFNARHNYD